jgi:hypothetical protein
MMLRTDPSVWIEHFQKGLPPFAARLEEGIGTCHSIVIGELAAGNPKHRRERFSCLRRPPRAGECDFEETMDFLEHHRLVGPGSGCHDAPLLAAGQLSAMPISSADTRRRKNPAKRKTQSDWNA